MAIKLSPEYWIGGLIKSATNGRVIPVKTKRILTSIIIPIWIVGLIICIQGFTEARKASKYYNEQKVRLDALNSTYSRDNGKFDNSRGDYLSGMRWAEEKMNGYYYGIYFLLICFVIPWVIVRLIFWVMDSDKTKE